MPVRISGASVLASMLVLILVGSGVAYVQYERAERNRVRAWTVRFLRPEITMKQAEDLVSESERMRPRVVTPGWFDARLAKVEINDADIHDAWNAHRDVFGEQSFQESRYALVQLARLEKLRAELLSE
jgi:hypothetical protein